MPTGVYVRDPETEALRRMKISAAMKGRESPLRGRLMPEETKREISKAMTGPNHPNFKGERTASGGYILIYQPNNPRADDSGYMKRADLIMEQKVGRCLHAGEVSHHKNGIKTDDRPENLELCANTGEHTKLHHRQGDISLPEIRGKGKPFQKGFDPRRFKGRSK